VDSVNMSGLYMFVQFGLLSIARLAIIERKPEFSGLINIWFLGILGHFLFSFSLPITRLTKYFDYFIILIMPYTIQYLNDNYLCLSVLWFYRFQSFSPPNFFIFLLTTYYFVISD